MAITYTQAMYFLDATNFNSTTGSEWDFRVETVQDGKCPTVRRVRIFYRDLGQCTITVTLDGFNEDGSAVATQSKQITIGTVGANGKIKLAYADLVLTAEFIQCKITRAANAGPLCITRVTLVGALEEMDNI